MPVATSDLYSVLLAIDEEWVQCQADLEEHIVESVKAFLSTTERDQDGHRILPNPDRLDAAESEVRSHSEVIRKIRDDACDYLAFKLGNGWSGRDVARCLESEDREQLEIAIEAMRRPWHSYVLRQLREKYPEQLAAIEGKRLHGVAEQAPPPPLANDGSDAARAAIEIADDGRSARWGNEIFTFTPLQAQMVVRLNASRLHGTGIVSEADLQEAASETDQPVRSVFRDKKIKGPHAAIRLRFIVSPCKGLWKITDQSPL